MVWVSHIKKEILAVASFVKFLLHMILIGGNEKVVNEPQANLLNKA